MNVIFLLEHCRAGKKDSCRGEMESSWDEDKEKCLDDIMSRFERIPAISQVIVVTSMFSFVDALRWKYTSPYASRWRYNSGHKKSIHIIENKGNYLTHRTSELDDLYLALKTAPSESGDFLVVFSDGLRHLPMNHFLLFCLGHKDKALVGLLSPGAGTGLLDHHAVVMDKDGKVVRAGSHLEHTGPVWRAVGLDYFPSRFLLRVFHYLKIERTRDDRLIDFLNWLSSKETVYGIELDVSLSPISGEKLHI